MVDLFRLKSNDLQKISDEEYEDDQSPEEKEWNLKEEMTCEKICLTLLSESNWNGLATRATSKMRGLAGLDSHSLGAELLICINT